MDYKRTRGAAHEERLAKATGLRELATLVSEAHALVKRVDQQQLDLQAFQAQVSNDVRTQLGLACARRRVKAADFVGQFASSSNAMSRQDFAAMTHSLVANAHPDDTDFLFDELDGDRSGALDLTEAARALSSMQRHGDEMHKDRLARERAIYRTRKKAEAKIQAVQTLHRSGGLVRGGAVALATVTLPPPSTVTQTTTSEREAHDRRERIAMLVQGAVRRWSSKQLSRGWTCWLEFAHMRRHKKQSLRLGVIHLLLHGFVKAFHKWVKHYEEGNQVRQLLNSRLSTATLRVLQSSFAAWSAWRASAAAQAQDGPPCVVPLVFQTKTNTPAASLCETVRACLGGGAKEAQSERSTTLSRTLESVAIDLQVQMQLPCQRATWFD